MTLNSFNRIETFLQGHTKEYFQKSHLGRVVKCFRCGFLAICCHV